MAPPKSKNAERVAEWRKRQKEDPELYEKYKEKERERYKRKKEKGLIKMASEMTQKELKGKRSQWKKNQRGKRERDKMMVAHVQNLITPPNSPEPHHVEERGQRNHVIKRGRKKVRKDRARAYREIFLLRVKLAQEKKLKEKYKKRLQRVHKKGNEDDVLKKADEMIRNRSSRKALILHNIMVRNIRNRYKCSSHETRRMISSLIGRHNVLTKYRLQNYARKVLGIRQRKTQHRQVRIEVGETRIKKDIREFMERDDNSRIKAGKKSTITRKKEKKQIRLLNDDLKCLHSKFVAEGNKKVSYSLFCSLKPFWILRPNATDRETCLCKIHENLKLKLAKCNQHKFISTIDIEAQMKTITCDTNRKDCMYRECSDCKGKVMHADCENEGEQVWWHTWKNRKVEKEKKNASGESIKKSVSITVKEKDCGTAKTLLEDTNVELQKTCRHVYNIRHQYGAIRSLREKVTGDEAIIHIDFSENFNCKYFEEIQSMHFGASQRQITLHTGVFYSKTTTQSFCTVSDCLQHGPPAIWAHLEPILDMLKSDVKILHFISDGPTTQYRNKQNFYLLSKVIFEMGFSGATWNFLEAGHGKGAADGVGAAIKRHADALVTVKKQDIMCANDLVSGLETMSSSIMVFKVDESRVLELEASIPPKLQAIPQTMKIHQVLVEHQYATRSRILSCFCKYPDTCACYAPREFIFQAVGAPNESSSVIGRQESEGRPEEASANLLLTHESNDSQPTVRSEEEQVGHSSTTLITLDCVDESLIGKYCVVVYDALPYPGVITDVDEDEEVEVNVMHKIGRNRYFWPRMEDILWYKKSDVMTLLDTVPRHVTGRHQEIDPDIWRLIEAKLELE